MVLGTALLMEQVGLSMAMGAFLAGILLAESNFRHQLEADIEPFRGMLLGLFFMSVGMSIDGNLVREVAWRETELRIDWSERPVEELGELLGVWLPQRDDYVTRALDPEAAPAYGVPGDPDDGER